MGKPRTTWDHPVSPPPFDKAMHRMCDGKTSYPCKKIAAAKARLVGGTMGAYHCLSCHRWHIGHSKSRPRRPVAPLPRTHATSGGQRQP
jgi:hypothetical protein